MEIDSLPLLIKKCKLKQIDAFFPIKNFWQSCFFFFFFMIMLSAAQAPLQTLEIRLQENFQKAGNMCIIFHPEFPCL